MSDNSELARLMARANERRLRISKHYVCLPAQRGAISPMATEGRSRNKLV